MVKFSVYLNRCVFVMSSRRRLICYGIFLGDSVVVPSYNWLIFQNSLNNLILFHPGRPAKLACRFDLYIYYLPGHTHSLDMAVRKYCIPRETGIRSPVQVILFYAINLRNKINIITKRSKQQVNLEIQ